MQIPKKWKEATLVPILKKDKPAKDPKSEICCPIVSPSHLISPGTVLLCVCPTLSFSVTQPCLKESDNSAR